MKFSSHSCFVAKKLNSCIYILNRYKKLLPRHILKIIFNCIGFSYINYCMYAYFDFLRVSDIRMIERKYVRCGRLILNDNESSKDAVLTKLGWLSIEDLLTKNKDKMLHSVINGSFAPTLKSYLSKPQHTHATRFNDSSYKTPACNKTMGIKAFNFWAPRNVNNFLAS